MTDHLTDEQITEALFNGARESAAAHLGDCEQCREELNRLCAVLTAARRQADADAARPHGFWHQQRLAIRERIWGTQTRGFLWAAATAALVLVAMLLSLTEPAREPLASNSDQGPATVSQAADSDHALLVEVERSVRRGVPRALEAATLIAQELQRATEARKEQRNP